MNWLAAAKKGIYTERLKKQRYLRGLQRRNKAATTIQGLVRKFLKTEYHQSQKKKWERDQRIKERDEKRKYRDSVSSHSDELKRSRRYIQQMMRKIEDNQDRKWEDFGRCPSHHDRMDDYYSEYPIYDPAYGDYWANLEDQIEEIDDRLWYLKNGYF